MKKVILNKRDKNIPIHTIIEKKKVLFHDAKKVLFFERTRHNNTYLFLPTFTEGAEFRKKAIFMQSFIDNDKLEPFYETINYFKFFECDNNSLKPLYEKQIRIFESCYHEFTDEEIHLILDCCFKERLKAHMLSFDEIRNMELRKKFYFDFSDVEVCNELESEIKKYVKR